MFDSLPLCPLVSFPLSIFVLLVVLFPILISSSRRHPMPSFLSLYRSHPVWQRSWLPGRLQNTTSTLTLTLTFALPRARCFARHSLICLSLYLFHQHSTTPSLSLTRLQLALFAPSFYNGHLISGLAGFRSQRWSLWLVFLLRNFTPCN